MLHKYKNLMQPDSFSVIAKSLAKKKDKCGVDWNIAIKKSGWIDRLVNKSERYR